MNWFIDGWRTNDKETKDLLKDNELWFVVVANPDGYQYTFDLSDCGARTCATTTATEITRADGVDPNRNYPEHFGYDEEGSSSQSAARRIAAPRRDPSPRRRR